jgi:Mg2+ and Co2+ transporter CorA
MRNRIVKMNLYMEMCGLGVAVSACITSFFGMNLITGLEDHPFAFFLTAALIVMTCGFIVIACLYRFRSITHSGKTCNYPILKNMFR